MSPEEALQDWLGVRPRHARALVALHATDAPLAAAQLGELAGCVPDRVGQAIETLSEALDPGAVVSTRAGYALSATGRAELDAILAQYASASPARPLIDIPAGPLTKAQIGKLYMAGVSTVVIADRAGVSRQRIEQIARNLGLPHRNPERRPRCAA